MSHVFDKIEQQGIEDVCHLCYFNLIFLYALLPGMSVGRQSDASITMPYDELQVCKAFILALSELNSLMCIMSVSEGSSQGYSRLLAFRMTYCIEFSELTRHALEEEGRENKREARVCSMQS